MSDRNDIIPTGFYALDDLLDGGPRRGELIVVTGPRGAGKTILLLQVLGERVRQGGRVLFAGGEQLDKWMRELAQRLGADGIDVLDSKADGVYVDEVTLRAREIGADVVVVDSLQLAKVSADVEEDFGNRVVVEDVIHELKAFAKTGTIVFLICHQTKQGTLATSPQKIAKVADAVLRLDVVCKKDEDGRLYDTGVRELSVTGSRFRRSLRMTEGGFSPLP